MCWIRMADARSPWQSKRHGDGMRWLQKKWSTSIWSTHRPWSGTSTRTKSSQPWNYVEMKDNENFIIPFKHEEANKIKHLWMWHYYSVARIGSSAAQLLGLLGADVVHQLLVLHEGLLAEVAGSRLARLVRRQGPLQRYRGRRRHGAFGFPYLVWSRDCLSKAAGTKESSKSRLQRGYLIYLEDL